MGTIRPKGYRLKRAEPKKQIYPVRERPKEIIPDGKVLELFKKNVLTGQMREIILIELKDLIAKQHNLERTIDFDTAELLLAEERLRLEVKTGRKIRIPEITKPLEKAEAIFEVFRDDYIKLKKTLSKLGLSNVQSLKFMSDVLVRYNLPDNLKTLLLRLIKAKVYPEV